MSANKRVVSLFSLLFLLALAGFADDLAPTFEEAAARGDSQEHAAATKEYFIGTLLPYFGRKYASVLQSCFASTPAQDNSQFSFVAAIGSDGRIVRLYSKHDTNIFQCMRGALKADVFPEPPVSPYYLHIEMNFTGRQPSNQGDQEEPLPLVREPDKYSYTFGVPKGWEYDFDQAQDRGARLAFFPKGGSFERSDNVVYVNEFYELCSDNCSGAVSRAIAKTIRQSKAESPALQVSIEPALKTKEGGQALIRILERARDPRVENSEAKDKEALAFIEHNEAVIVVVLTARNPKTWEQDYSAFREIVSGHKFFNCNTPGLVVPCQK